MADWEEIKRLAADFQKIQLTSTNQRLSDRNCIEIMSWLVDRKVVDLIFTSDGKEYLTTSQLITDIKYELFLSGGRIDLVDLAKIIGVDYDYISHCVNSTLKGQKDIYYILGQLINNSYILKIANEINEKLTQQGQIDIGDLTIQYDLPTDFLQLILEKHLGIKNINDPNVLFSEPYIVRTKCKIRGALLGLTKPASVSSLLPNTGINDKLFSIFDQLFVYGIIARNTSGGQYIPRVYTNTQNKWIQNFFKQNGYLEFNTLVQLGISDYRSYIKKNFASEHIFFLDSCVISKQIVDQTDAVIDECLLAQSYVDIRNNLPSIFNEKDIEIVLKKITGKSPQPIVINTFVISLQYIDKLTKNCDDLVAEKAQSIVDSGKFKQYVVLSSELKHEKPEMIEKVNKKEERRKKNLESKYSDEGQSRETRTKSSKKQNKLTNSKTERDYSALETKSQLEIVKTIDVKNAIKLLLVNEETSVLIDQLVDFIYPEICDKALTIATETYYASIADCTNNRRNIHSNVQTKLNALIGEVKLFDKGNKLLPPDLQKKLSKYLLKTICTEIAVEILNYVGLEQNLSGLDVNANNEQRIKYINQFPSEYGNLMHDLMKSLADASIDNFLLKLEDVLTACNMFIRKTDKKKDRSIIASHKSQLIEQLHRCEDPPVVLHLALLIIFISATGNMIHASGKHVAELLNILKTYLPEEEALQLSSYHDLVYQLLSDQSNTEYLKEFERMSPLIKSIAINFKKISA